MLWPLYFETGHWRADFLTDRMTGTGRPPEAMSGCFVDAKREGSGLSRLAASERTDGLLWVDSSPPGQGGPVVRGPRSRRSSTVVKAVDAVGKVGQWGGDKGSAVAGKVVDKVGTLSQWGGDKGRVIGGAVAGKVGRLGRWGDDKLAHARALDQVRHWGDRLGARVGGVSPVETARELARLADDERARLLDALRRAVATLPARTGQEAWHPEPPLRARSQRPESTSCVA